MPVVWAASQHGQSLEGRSSSGHGFQDLATAQPYFRSAQHLTTEWNVCFKDSRFCWILLFHFLGHKRKPPFGTGKINAPIKHPWTPDGVVVRFQLFRSWQPCSRYIRPLLYRQPFLVSVTFAGLANYRSMKCTGCDGHSGRKRLYWAAAVELGCNSECLLILVPQPHRHAHVRTGSCYWHKGCLWHSP